MKKTNLLSGKKKMRLKRSEASISNLSTQGANQKSTALSGEKQARIIYLLNSIRDLSQKEANRIFSIYFNKLLTVQTAMNYYKICLVLFGNKHGGKEVSKFIKLKLVSLTHFHILTPLRGRTTSPEQRRTSPAGRTTSRPSLRSLLPMRPSKSMLTCTTWTSHNS